MAVKAPVNKDAMPLHKNDTYQVVITVEPEGKYRLYGVQNRQTEIMEAYISNLARAIQVADQFQYALKHGLDAMERGDMDAAIASALGGPLGIKGPAGGKAN